MNIHTRLRALILITLVPIAVFGVAGAVVLVKKERDTLARGLQDQVRAIMNTIDTELYASVSPLQLLARSPSLDRDDFEAFRVEAARALDARRGDWANIFVSHPESAQMLMNVLSPPGAPLAAPIDPGTVRDAARAGKPTISQVVMGPLLKRPIFAVRVPVMRDGSVRYVLSVVVETGVIQRLIEKQGLPAAVAVAVLDRNYRFVARVPAPEPASEFASESLRRSLAGADEGWQRGSLLDGTDVFRAFRRSPLSGWATSIAVPAKVVEQDMLGTWLLVAGFIAAAALGLWIAWILAARITAPIAALAAAAPAIGRGEASALPPSSSIDEVRELSQALRDAAVAIHDREERQRAAEQSLVHADRAKDEFLAMLGHELRNPLASVANVTQLLEFAERRPELLASVREILGRQVAHMTHLLDDLLEVGRLAGGKIRLDRTAIDLGVVASELLGAWREGGRFARHDVHAALESAWVRADRVRIEQVLSNLVDNALKYTPAGGRIDVTVRPQGAQAMLEVKDAGHGIEADLIGRIFDLFVQGERSLAREGGGLGIGLTMAKRIVELHEGTIDGASEGEGRGSRFTVLLPRVERPAMQENGSVAPGAPKQRILVVEDNADARDSLVALLGEFGHEVHAAASGESAVAMAADISPDVVLVDIGLPDIDGYEVARRLLALPGSARRYLIALTGYGSPEDRQRAMSSGFDAHLIKPLDVGALDALLRIARA